VIAEPPALVVERESLVVHRAPENVYRAKSRLTAALFFIGSFYYEGKAAGIENVGIELE
jgi:hypothetical protein